MSILRVSPADGIEELSSAMNCQSQALLFTVVPTTSKEIGCPNRLVPFSPFLLVL